jgi:hypothetical protein
MVFEKNANFVRRKLSKIAENCDHNIDPSLETFHLKTGLWYFAELAFL